VAFLLDTNLLSEVVRPDSDERVRTWLRSLARVDSYISTLTLGEIAKGVALLPEGKRRDVLRGWLSTDLVRRFHGRILPVDAHVAELWGSLSAEAQRAGRPLPVVDGLLLATAGVHGLTFATRDTRDCAGRGVPVHDPWTG